MNVSNKKLGWESKVLAVALAALAGIFAFNIHSTFAQNALEGFKPITMVSALVPSSSTVDTSVTMMGDFVSPIWPGVCGYTHGFTVGLPITQDQMYGPNLDSPLRVGGGPPFLIDGASTTGAISIVSWTQTFSGVNGECPSQTALGNSGGDFTVPPQDPGSPNGDSDNNPISNPDPENSLEDAFSTIGYPAPFLDSVPAVPYYYYGVFSVDTSGLSNGAHTIGICFDKSLFTDPNLGSIPYIFGLGANCFWGGFNVQHPAFGTIVVNSVDQNSQPVAASWTLTGPATLPGSAETSQTYAHEPTGPYTLTPGTPPPGYTLVGVNSSTAQTLLPNGTTTFTIVWLQQPRQITCSGPSNVIVGTAASFMATDGSGNYSWTASQGGASPSTGSGSDFSTTFSQVGDWNVGVTDGTNNASCNINVISSDGYNCMSDYSCQYVASGAEYPTSDYCQFECTPDITPGFDCVESSEGWYSCSYVTSTPAYSSRSSCVNACVNTPVPSGGFSAGYWCDQNNTCQSMAIGAPYADYNSCERACSGGGSGGGSGGSGGAGYNCVDNSCQHVASGATYDSFGSCEPDCYAGYNCVSGSCAYVSADAQYHGFPSSTALTSCQAGCGGAGYNCVDNSCQPVASGATYNNIAYCDEYCDTGSGYDCDTGNDSCFHVASNATYSDSTSCAAACGGGPPSSHFACANNNSCALVPGQQANDCFPPGSSCDTSHFHNICDLTDNTCTQIAGQGTDDCSTIGSSCVSGPPPPSHMACLSNSCTSVPGQALSDCLGAGSLCDTSHFHNVCDLTDNTCTQIAGQDTDDCSTIGSSCVGGPSLSVTFFAAPSSGYAPLSSMLMAITSGGAGTYNYTFWKDCAYSGTSVDAATAQCGTPTKKEDGISATIDSANVTYADLGTFHPIVIVENGANAVEAETAVRVSSGGPRYSCSGPGGSCTLDAGGHYTASNCDNSCGGGGQPPVCTMNPPSPATILLGQFSTLSWSCTNATNCNLTGAGSVNPVSGSSLVHPTTTAQYILTCINSSTSTPATAAVTVKVVSSPGLHEVTP
jgi:hypothetical protein